VNGINHPAVTYPTGPNPIAIAIADFNNDTNPDLAVLNNNCPSSPCAGAGSVSILLGNGDGTFQSQLTTTVGNNPLALGAADLNGDLNVDVIVTNSADNTASILINRGGGLLTLKKNYTTGVAPAGLVIGDFNDDTKLDLIVANTGDSTIWFFKGSGNGTFLSPFVFPTGLNPVGLVTADFNSDQIPDLATANTGASTISILINRGKAGGFGFIPPADFPVAGPATQLVTTDLNNDGQLDLAVASPSMNAVSVLLSAGNANFHPHVDYATGANPVALTTTQGGALDFTGDGTPDLAVVNSVDNSVSVLANAGPGVFQARRDVSIGNQPSSIATGDLNGDQIKDMVIANRNGNSLLLLFGNGDGTFSPSGTLPTGSNPSWVTAADLNHDGMLDLVSTNAGDNTISVFLAAGSGTFQTAVPYTVGKHPVYSVAADFNKDGYPDLAVVNQNDPSISVFLNNRDGTFRFSKSYFTGSGTAPTAIAAADLGTGNISLVVADGTAGSVSVFVGKGTGAFSPAVGYTVGSNATGVAIQDFDQDGRNDLIVVNNGSNSVSFLQGNGDGTFINRADYPTTSTPYLAAAADFNGDGFQDIAVSSSSSTSDRVSILLGNGNGSFRPGMQHISVFASKGLGEALAVDDFNNDGVSDIVVGDQFASSISIFLNPPMPVFFPGAPMNFGSLNVGSSTSLSVTLMDSGSAPINDLSVNANSDYQASTACGSTLAIGASCDTTVTFTPTQAGSRPGLLTFTDNGPGAAQALALNGTGNGATADLNVTELTFPTTLVNTTSQKQNVIVTNNGNQVLNISNISVTGDFKETTTCGSTLPAGSSCTVSIAFRPKAAGVLTGTLTITDNAANSPQTVSLTGTGTVLQFQPTSLAFGNQPVGTTSSPQTFSMTNVGNFLVTISGINIVGNNFSDFVIQSTTCGASLPRNNSCTITVTFTPSQTGARTADVSITDNGGGSPQMVPLTGTGT